jgi:hypothetical protein
MLSYYIFPLIPLVDTLLTLHCTVLHYTVLQDPALPEDATVLEAVLRSDSTVAR